MNKYIKYIIESFFDDIDDDISYNSNNSIDTLISKNALLKITKHIDNTKYPGYITDNEFNLYSLYINLTNDIIDILKYGRGSYQSHEYAIFLYDDHDAIIIKSITKYNICYTRICILNNKIKFLEIPDLIYEYSFTNVGVTYYYELLSLLYDKYKLLIDNIIIQYRSDSDIFNTLTISINPDKLNYITINPFIYTTFPTIYIIDKTNIFTDDFYIDETKLTLLQFKNISIHAYDMDWDPKYIVSICDTIKNKKINKGNVITYESFGSYGIITKAHAAFSDWAYNNKIIVYPMRSQRDKDILKDHIFQSILDSYLIPTDGKYKRYMYSFDYTKGSDKEHGKYIDCKIDFEGDLESTGKHVWRNITCRFYLSGRMVNFNCKK